MKLKEKVAVITGASKGYGMEIAKAYAREGANVAICARGFDRLKKVADEIESSTRQKVLPVKADVTSKKEIEDFVEKTIETFGRIDILVNNAGVIIPATILDMKEEEMDMVFAINLKGPFLCTQAVAKHMVKQKSGKIINISSSQGRGGFALMSHYSATKGGLIAATRAWAMELVPYGILVNCIAYGTFPDEELKQKYPPEFWEHTTKHLVPLGKLGEPKDVTPIAVFLASSESDYMLGQTISYDGGMTMP